MLSSAENHGQATSKSRVTAAFNKSRKTYEINSVWSLLAAKIKKGKMLLDIKLAALLIWAASKRCSCAAVRGSCFISCWSRLNSLYCQKDVRSSTVRREPCMHVFVWLLPCFMCFCASVCVCVFLFVFSSRFQSSELGPIFLLTLYPFRDRHAIVWFTIEFGKNPACHSHNLTYFCLPFLPNLNSLLQFFFSFLTFIHFAYRVTKNNAMLFQLQCFVVLTHCIFQPIQNDRF